MPSAVSAFFIENRWVLASFVSRSGCRTGWIPRSGVARPLKLEVEFGLTNGISEVVVMMAHWNKVYSVSPYLVNISGIGEGLESVGAIRSVVLHWILTVCVSFKGSYSLSMVGYLWSLRSFGSTVRSGFFNPLNWWLRIGSLCYSAVVPSAFIRSRCSRRVAFAVLLVRTFAGDSIFWCLLSLCLKLRQLSNDRRKMTNMNFSVFFLLCTALVTSGYISFVPAVFFNK